MANTPMTTARCLLILAATLQTGCMANAPRSGTAPAAARVMAPGNTVAMSPGDTFRFKTGGTLRFVGIVADSRCQPGVQCIWAGDAEAAFEDTTASGGTRRFSLHTTLQPTEIALEAGILQLKTVDREHPPNVTVRLQLP